MGAYHVHMYPPLVENKAVTRPTVVKSREFCRILLLNLLEFAVFEICVTNGPREGPTDGPTLIKSNKFVQTKMRPKGGKKIFL